MCNTSQYFGDLKVFDDGNLILFVIILDYSNNDYNLITKYTCIMLGKYWLSFGRGRIS